MFKFHSKVVLRAPLLSFEAYDISQLSKLIKTGVFQSSLFLANYEFYEQLLKKHFDYNLLTEKEKKTLCSYYNRMSFRSTPFGAFASFSLLEWQSGINNIVLEPQKNAKLHLLVDQQATLKIVDELRKQPGQFGFFANNPTVYRLNKELRYIRSIRATKTGKVTFHLSTVENSPGIKSLIQLLKSGLKSYSELVSHLTDKFNFDNSEAENYISILIESQLILSSLDGGVLGKDYFLRLTKYAEHEHWPFAKYYKDILEEMENISFPDPVLLQSVADKFNQAFKQNEVLPDKKMFYSILERFFSGGINKQYQEQINNVIPVLLQLTAENKPGALISFIEKFKAKFDGQKISILQALDPDIGIDYDGRAVHMEESNLCENIRFRGKTNDNTTVKWTPVHKLLLNKFISTAPGKGICILDEDLNAITHSNVETLPPSMSVMFSFTTEHLILEAIGGSSATALNGRFTICNNDILAVNKQIADTEQQYNAAVIFAEINFLTDAHTDNINRREAVYDYEIPINATSDLALEKQLLLSDLYLSVSDGELVLESKRLKKRVIPRLSSSYNYQNNQLGICRLLGDLQYQGIQGSLKPDLERIFPELSYYPRICYKDVIISLALWRLTPGNIKRLTKGKDDENICELLKLLEENKIPKNISIKYSDQLLTFNLNRHAECLFFLKSLKGDSTVTIQEYLQLASIVTDKRNQALSHQFIGLLISDQQVYKKTDLPAFEMSNNGIREFVLGSQWLFLKIYCQPSTSNLLLTKYLLPFLKETIGIEVDLCFFIRYTDPDFHIRFRILVKDEKLIADLLIRLNSKLSNDLYYKIIRDYKADVYSREIERYGADFMLIAEKIFHASSMLILHYIKKTQSPNFVHPYYAFALISAHQIIQQFFSDTQDQCDFTGQLVRTFYQEYEDPQKLKYELDLKYREINNDTYILLKEGKFFQQLKLVKLKKLFDEQIGAFLVQGKKVEKRKRKFAADIIHMHLNRLFVSDQREQEFIVYYTINKYLITELNIQKRVI